MTQVEIRTQIGLISVHIEIEDDYDTVKDWKGREVGAARDERYLAELAHAALRGIREQLTPPVA